MRREFLSLRRLLGGDRRVPLVDVTARTPRGPTAISIRTRPGRRRKDAPVVGAQLAGLSDAM
jgi:hypothetical protein